MVCMGGTDRRFWLEMCRLLECYLLPRPQMLSAASTLSLIKSVSTNKLLQLLILLVLPRPWPSARAAAPRLFLNVLSQSAHDKHLFQPVGTILQKKWFCSFLVLSTILLVGGGERHSRAEAVVLGLAMWGWWCWAWEKGFWCLLGGHEHRMQSCRLWVSLRIFCWLKDMC